MGSIRTDEPAGALDVEPRPHPREQVLLTPADEHRLRARRVTRQPPSSRATTSDGQQRAATQDGGSSPPVEVLGDGRPAEGSTWPVSTGQPSSQTTSSANVSRPSTCHSGLEPRARTPW